MFEVLLESSIGFSDDSLIEFVLAATRLFASHEKNPVPVLIECRSNAPNAAIRPETNFFHVGEGRAFQRIRVRPPQSWFALPQCHN